MFRPKTPTVPATANALATTTTSVNVSNAAAPSAGQALIATGGSAATWQDIDAWYEYKGKKFVLNNPYSAGGSLHLKGMTHVHCNNSLIDNSTGPSATTVVTAYKNAGYDWFTLTDHDRITADPGVSGITWIGSSVEETGALTRTAQQAGVHHVISLDTTSQYDGCNMQDTIDYQNNLGAISQIAHCAWIGYFIMDENYLTNLHSYQLFEIYNRAVEYHYGALPDGYSSEGYSYDVMWDKALSIGKRCWGVAVDDYHNNINDFNYGWIVTHSDENTATAIKASLKSGNFYASTGNDITITLSGLDITATSTASSTFTFHGRNGKILKTEAGVTTSTYTIVGDEYYVRVRSTLTSNVLYRAWSQPIFLDYLGNDEKSLAELRDIIYPRHIGAQAFINGNFDIWQRATSFTNPATNTFTADKWNTYYDAAGGALPTTITHARRLPDSVTLSPMNGRGMMEYGFYAYRVTMNSAGSGFGAGAYYILRQHIEHGVRMLCGDGMKVTLSFEARSTITGKKLGIDLVQNYGTGGSPEAAEVIAGETINLKNYYVRYEIPIEVNPRDGGPDWSTPIGTNDDDYLSVRFWLMWGSTYNSYVGASAAETFVGSGSIDIIHCKLNVGGKSIPFYPKAYRDELSDCQRHCFVPDTPATASVVGEGIAVSTTVAIITVKLPTPMRGVPTLSATATEWQLSDGVTQTDLTAIAIDTTRSNKNVVVLTCTVASGLTQFRPYVLQCDGTANRKLILSAEI